ncbi:hypothetical protein GCM10018952_02680 [Streptosporangium vulgare]
MPAATMVAAWMRALIGVGPAIASGSQTCNGTWALFPATPASRSMVAAMSVPDDISGTPAMTSAILKLPAAVPRTKMPNRNPTSPIRVTRNALIAARELALSSHQCPTSR